MAVPIGNERQVTFFKNDGHNHDGENSSPVVIQPGAISMFHLNNALINWIKSQGSSGTSGGGDVMPVPDLEFQTPPLGAGASYQGSIPWVGLSIVRFMRVMMSQDSECTITFYHKSTFADEDREFRAIRCGNGFLWEGAWAHYDEDNTKHIHYKIENTGNSSAVFKILIKSGTMAANAYSRFVEGLIVNGDDVSGTINLFGGNGVQLVHEGNTITFNATAPETVYVKQWALTPVKPVAFHSSAPITNIGYLSDGRTDRQAVFGTDIQWIQADIGTLVNLGGVNINQYHPDGIVHKDVRVEVSSDTTSWIEVKSAGDHWSVPEGLTVHMPSGFLARYIRVWCNGNSANTNNYMTKIVPLVISNKG